MNEEFRMSLHEKNLRRGIYVVQTLWRTNFSRNDLRDITIFFTDRFGYDDTIAATRPILSLPSRTVECTRRPRLFHEAFVRSIMNSVSFVEGGSFLLAPSKLRSLHRRDGKGQRRRDTGNQAGEGGGNL